MGHGGGGDGIERLNRGEMYLHIDLDIFVDFVLLIELTLGDK